MRIPDVLTPALVVDERVLDANIAAMADHAAALEVRLRPHAKTHKSPAVAHRQLAAGADGLTVATLAEAEVFAEAGCDDLFVAYPLYADARRGARLRALAERVRLSVGVDSAEGAQALARHAGTLPVLVEVDSGMHRSGVPAEEAGGVAEAAAGAGLEVDGVFTFPGHGYSPGAAATVAREEAIALAAAAGSLAAHGLQPRVLSGGSTPTADQVEPGTLTELRPGVYVFGDAQQWELGTIDPDRIALSCLTRVVSDAGGRLVTDAGSKALGADRPSWATGYGRVLDHPEARVPMLSEHHAVLTWPDTPPPRWGSLLRVVPNHVCAAVNLADELVVVRDGAVVDTWPVTARGANA